MTKNRFACSIVAAVVTGAVLMPMAPAAAFEIDKKATLIPVNPHGGQPIHEQITAEAVALAGKPVGSKFVGNLNQGVQNADIVHAFDSEAHFDNASVSAGVGFAPAFSMLAARLQVAKVNAANNPHFRNPAFGSFRDIAKHAAAALATVAKDKKCIKRIKCPTMQFAKRALAALLLQKTTLSINQNPDPHVPTFSGSPFGLSPTCSKITAPMCKVVSFVTKLLRGSVWEIESYIAWALGSHKGVPLAKLVKPATLKAVQVVRDELKAYRAFQELGHALHATQDFFAHSDYVELMTDTLVEDPIAHSAPNPATGAPWQPGEIPLPASFSQFSLSGLESTMGAELFSYLETGNLRARWLGQGNVCAGKHLFNPTIPIKTPKVKIGAYTFPSVELSLNGANLDPGDEFGYCHYPNSDWEGLNKDEPCADGSQTDPAKCDEPSHLNHYYARAAAVQMSTMLLKAWPGY
jgi:hypothetical protein